MVLSCGGGEYARCIRSHGSRIARLSFHHADSRTGLSHRHNYKESSYPVALYNWFAENPYQQALTVSLPVRLDKWWAGFAIPQETFTLSVNAQNKNVFRAESISDAKMQGIVFDRSRTGPVSEEWDGQFAIAALALLA